MNNDLIRLSRKAANEWRNNDAYYQASVLIDSLCDMLENAPVVDAVPVVRCKDCKHKLTTVYSAEHGKFLVCKVFGGKRHQPDDFCSYGKLKEGE